MPFLGNIIERPTELEQFIALHGWAVAAIIVAAWGCGVIINAARG